MTDPLRLDPLRHRAPLLRKAPQLPCYVEIPDRLVAPWKLQGTTMVDAEVNGQPIGRRSIKAWGDGQRWFIELTAPQIRTLGVQVGDTLDMSLALADASPPNEVASLIERDDWARSRWQKMTPSQQRQVAERIRAAKQAATRERRAKNELGGPSDPNKDR